MNPILDQILKETFTLHEFRARTRLLKEGLVSKFFGGPNVGQIPSTKENLTWMQNLSPEFLNRFNKDNLYTSFENLTDEASKIPTLTMYVPTELPEVEIDKIGLSLRQQTGKILLLEVKLDPTLLAGCALVWNGVYKDYSLRKKIEENKEGILGQFRSFLK